MERYENSWEVVIGDESLERKSSESFPPFFSFWRETDNSKARTISVPTTKLMATT